MFGERHKIFFYFMVRAQTTFLTKIAFPQRALMFVWLISLTDMKRVFINIFMQLILISLLLLSAECVAILSSISLGRKKMSSLEEFVWILLSDKWCSWWETTFLFLFPGTPRCVSENRQWWRLHGPQCCILWRDAAVKLGGTRESKGKKNPFASLGRLV